MTDGARSTEPTSSRPADGAGAAVHLHLHRGIGWGVYGVGTVIVLGLVLAGIWFNLAEGRYLSALAITVVGLGTAGFLGVATHAMVTPALTVTPAGVRGRLPHGMRVDVDWSEVVVDVEDEARPGELRIVVGDGSATVSARQWTGFPEFVVLLGETPAAAARLTPPARREAIRLLGIVELDPGALDDGAEDAEDADERT